MRIPDLLTSGERRLVVLLFVLAVASLATREGARLSPEVEAWLEDPGLGDPEGAHSPSRDPAAGAQAAGGTADSARSVPSAPAPGDTSAGTGTADPGGSRGGTLRVDPNRADAATLMTLPGIGPALAGRILEDRARRGPYRTAADLLRVPGIGPATLARIREHLLLPP